MSLLRFAPVLAACLIMSSCSGEKANGFITENADIEVAEKGDVPRDDTGRPFHYKLLGQPVPEFEVTLPSGEVVTREALLGQWTVVEFWGLWCPDCIVDGPNVQKLADAIEEDPDLSLLTIHAPPSAQRADEAYGKYGSVGAYFEAQGFDYIYALDPDASAKSAFQLSWVPTFLLVDPEGVVRGFQSDLGYGSEAPVQAFLDDVKRVIDAQ